MASTFTVAGTAIDPATDDTFQPVRFSERFGAIPTLTIQRRGGALPALPDPWIGKEVTWTWDGTTHFVGDVVSMTPSFNRALGWVLTYQCLGLKNRLDAFPHTDANTGIDSSAYNLTPEDPNYNPARGGRTVGEILADVLTMTANAQAIDAAGIGNYTGLPSAPVLPTITTDDLALLTIIPHRPLYFTGEKFGSAALDGFLQQWAPNVRYWIDRGGNHRFLDLRTFTPQTLTMGTDDIEPSELSRDIGDCFNRVVVRGQPIAVLPILKLSNGDLVEAFTHDSFITNATAKAAWTPAQFRQPGAAQVVGTCTCGSTTTITVDPTDASVAWSANFWDQTHQMGVITLSSSTVTDYTQFWSSRIVANAALTAGGTGTITIDNPLPHTNFDKFTITGLSLGGAVVWTQYQVVNTDLWPRVAKQSTYPQPFISPNGNSAGLTSTKMGVVLWSSNGSPPYNSFPLDFDFNPTTGMVRFKAPTWTIANNAAPADVWVAIPIQTNPLQAIEPPDVAGVPQYDGTSYTVDGQVPKTLTVNADFWRDPGQLAQLQDYAADLLDSVKDAVVEGSIVHYGMFEDALTFGLALNVAGDDGDGAYDTGWEDLDLPIVGVDLEWPVAGDDALDIRTSMQVSNRRAHYSAEVFLSPEQRFLELGAEGNPFDATSPDNVVGKAVPQAGLSTGNDIGAPKADLSGIPTSMGDLGIPTSPGDMGLPTTMSDLGLPTSPGEVLGGGESQAPPADAADAPDPTEE